MHKDLLRNIVYDYSDDILKSQVYPRHYDLSKTLQYEEADILKGIRRSGKTYLIYRLAQNKDLLYLNFEDERLIDFSPADFAKLYEIGLETWKDQKIVVFDEVQNAPGWEKFVFRMYKKVKFIITGSSSYFLNSLSPLTGRHREHIIFPLSFTEYLHFTQNNTCYITSENKASVRNAFNNYLTNGGFPKIVLNKDFALLEDYFRDIVFRDVLKHAKIDNPDILERLSFYLLSNVCGNYSYRKLAESAGLRHEETVKKYVMHLKNAYLFYELKRFDFSLNKQERSSKKIYTIDTGLLTHVSKRFSKDIGKVLENAAFIQLKRQFKNIYYFSGKGEVDFIVCDSLKPRIAIQISSDISDKDTFKREIKALKEAKKKLNISKAVLFTMTPEFESEGVEIVDIVSWFLGNYTLTI